MFCVVAAHQRKMLSAAGKSLIGRTPAQLAALGGHDACLKLLLSSNASPERNEDEIMSPLFAAIAGSSADRSNPNPNPDCAIAGSSADRAATCRVLLEAKADLDAPDAVGLGPLHCAAEDEHEEAIRLLLQYGADSYAPSHSGLLPVDLAVKGGLCAGLFEDPSCMFWNLAAKARLIYLGGEWELARQGYASAIALI